MGIQGLLPLLKSIHKPTHLRSFSGQTLGIDAYGWLHRGTAACVIELAKGEPTRKHIDFALHRVRMLIHFGVKPYLVFDGGYLPSKAHTETERAARRQESKRAGLELLRMGRSSQAYLELQKAVDVTPAMARELIDELKRLDVPYVVAPYEADSQLAYLEKKGLIDGVISEDSDLLVFGVKCLITKLDQYGECVMINRDDFTSCRDISLVGWTDKEFRMMAMLSGCDYLPGISGMGLKTAYRLVRKHKTVEKVVRAVQFDGKKKLPAGYLDAFQNAEQTFMYQWAFCPDASRLVHLNPLPPGLLASSMPFIGSDVDPEVAAGVAHGDLDPNTKGPLAPPQRFQHPASRNRIVQTPDEKQGKPITEFFKKRTPLAELDPNSFTPSPSQQRLLQSQGNLTWSASQAPTTRPFGQARNINAPSSAPQATRRAVTDPFPTLRRASPKKQRLCSDSSIVAAMSGTDDQQTATSRFFANQCASQASPSTRKRSNRSKKGEFQLWSDDSVADAVVAATASTEATQSFGVSSPRKRKKLEVFADSPATEKDTSVGDISQDSIITTATVESEVSAILDTPDTYFETICNSPEQHTCSSKSMSTKLTAFKYGTPSMLGKQYNRSSLLFTSTPLQATKNSEQTMPSEGLDRPVDNHQSIIVPCSSPVDTHAKPNAGDDEEDTISDEDFFALEKQPLERPSSFKVQGSEDLLIPESPETVDDGHTTTKKLNISRFAFTG